MVQVEVEGGWGMGTKRGSSAVAGRRGSGAAQ